MSDNSPTPICFIAMPFGKEAPPGEREPRIDFDKVYECLEQGARLAGLECIRADFEPGGGFIHKSMFERLLVAEYVVADLTRLTANVLYVVGLRYGAGARPTSLVCAEQYVPTLSFDVTPLRLLRYSLLADGTMKEEEGKELASRLHEQLTLARQGKLPLDNSIMQVTSWQPSGEIGHSKTDVFLDRLQYQGGTAQRIKEAVLMKDDAAALAVLQTIESEIVDLPSDVAQVHTLLLGLFVAYREKRAYREMTELFERFPAELTNTPVAREQLALALNRRAEATTAVEAEDLRARALAALDAMDDRSVTSETYGIRGRIYKGWHDTLKKSQEKHDAVRAAAMLQKAIDTYEQGFKADLRDYYPGVNAVTLRLTRGTTEDREALRALLPVVRYAVDAAKRPNNTEERYWQVATKLELAAAEGDWATGTRHVQDLLDLNVQRWMRETTVKNLRLQEQALSGDDASSAQLREFIEALGA